MDHMSGYVWYEKYGEHEKGNKWAEHRKGGGENCIVTLLKSELEHFSVFHTLSNDLTKWN